MDGINVEIIIFNLIYFISILMDLVIDNLGIKIYMLKNEIRKMKKQFFKIIEYELFEYIIVLYIGIIN